MFTAFERDEGKEFDLLGFDWNHNESLDLEIESLNDLVALWKKHLDGQPSEVSARALYRMLESTSSTISKAEIRMMAERYLLILAETAVSNYSRNGHMQTYFLVPSATSATSELEAE